MADKKIYKSPADAFAAREEEHRNNHSVFQKAAAKVAKYVSSKGGLEKTPKVWAFVSCAEFNEFQGALVTEMLNGADWMEISDNYKKLDLNPSIKKQGTIYKFKTTSSFWRRLSKEVMMGVEETRFVKIDPQTGSVNECPQTFKFPSVGYAHPDAEQFQKLVQAIDSLVQFLMSCR